MRIVHIITRLIIGGSNSVYESPDQGDNVTQLTGPGANRNAMVYGHASNADLIVVGSGSQVFMRTTAGGNLTATAGAYPGGTVVLCGGTLAIVYSDDLEASERAVTGVPVPAAGNERRRRGVQRAAQLLRRGRREAREPVSANGPRVAGAADESSQAPCPVPDGRLQQRLAGSAALVGRVDGIGR